MTEENENPEVNEPGKPKGETRTLIEELEVAGNDLVKKVEELIREGNVRRLMIKHQDNVLLEIPLTVAAVAGAATVLISPVLAALGALAALLTQVTVVVVREEGKAATAKKKVDVQSEEEDE
jgi:hypothetical protein